MSKVWRQTFGAWQEDRERDERYQRLMQVGSRAGQGCRAPPDCSGSMWQGAALLSFYSQLQCPRGACPRPYTQLPSVRPCLPACLFMQALGFVDLPTLMGADVQPDPSLLAMAQVSFVSLFAQAAWAPGKGQGDAAATSTPAMPEECSCSLPMKLAACPACPGCPACRVRF